MKKLKSLITVLTSMEFIAVLIVVLSSYTILHYFQSSQETHGFTSSYSYLFVFLISVIVGAFYLYKKDKSREALTASNEEKLKEITKIISSTPSCLKILTKDGSLIEMNPQGLELIEAENLESVRGANVYDLVEESHKAKFKEFNERVCQGYTGRLVFEIIGLKGTRRWMETYAAPYTLADGSIGHVAITNEISEIIKSQTELEQQKKLALHNAKLASIGELATGVGHEINNPLAIIKGYLEVLEAKAKTNQTVSYDELKIYLNKINSASERIERIVKGLRTYARADINEFEKFDPVQCVEESVEMVLKIYQIEGITVNFHSHSLLNQMVLEGNRGKIQQVMMNLLSNAKDAVLESDNKEITVDLDLKNNELSIEVSDTGKGIPDAIKDKIFDPFFTTKDVSKGTGIGLSLVNNFIKDFKGSIHVVSRINEGTKFVIKLPVKLSAIEPQKTSKPSHTQTPSQFNCKALIVEDEPEIREVLSQVLRNHSIDVTCATNGQEALDLFLAQNHKFDLIVSDMKMPIMDGETLLREIRSNQSIKNQPKFVFFTGGTSVNFDDSNDELNKLIDGYFFKPFKKEHIHEMLNQVMASHRIK
ncbi:MAG: response regulator [Bacteriovoracaceae bacterium]|nr:response regulator [Bacteriovoracaceae bacterium]